jgi:hypothetical protein
VRYIVFFLVLAFCLLALPLAQGEPSSLPVATAQSSTPILLPPNGLWSRLLEQTQSLPANFDNFTARLTDQLALLKISNDDLISKNSLFTASLQASITRAETSEAKSAQLQTDLDNSMISITDAKKQATALELKAARWKILGYAGLVAGIAGLVYGLTR